MMLALLNELLRLNKITNDEYLKVKEKIMKDLKLDFYYTKTLF